jgi:hypothetical protein
MNENDEDRQLCPDGDCIGLIGPEGRCKECGREAEPAAADATEPEPGDADPGDDPAAEADGEGADPEGDGDEGEAADGEKPAAAESEPKAPASAAPDPESDEFVLRELCPNGSCIGLVGPDGRCKECGEPGRSARLDPRRRGMLTDRELDEDAGEVAEPEPEEPAEEEEEEDEGEGETDGLPPADPAFAERQLCPDGECIGIIGSEGRCRECGRSARAAIDSAGRRGQS